MLKPRQDGQALVSVLVVMLLIFLLAGAVAIGASALMARMTQTGSGISADFASQSAVAEMAYASTHNCSRSGNYAMSVVCAAQPQVPNSSLNPLSFGAWTLTSLNDLCSVTDVTSYVTSSQLAWIFLSARRKGAITFAYVAKSASSTPPICPDDPRLVSGVLSCPTAQTQEALVLSCALTRDATSHLYLVVRNDQPAQGFTVTAPASDGQQASSGAFYTAIAGTGFPFPMDFEQAILYVPSLGAPQLRYEAALP